VEASAARAENQASFTALDINSYSKTKGALKEVRAFIVREVSARSETALTAFLDCFQRRIECSLQNLAIEWV